MKYLIEYYQDGGYPHNIYLVSENSTGLYYRETYNNWTFLDNLKAKNNGLMLDLHNVTDTLWDRHETFNNQVEILNTFVKKVITKFNLDKLVVCSWVGNVNKTIGKSVNQLFQKTIITLDKEFRSKFVGIVIDTTEFKKRDFITRISNDDQKLVEKISPKPLLADKLNLKYLVDDSPNHLPDRFNKVKGLSFDLRHDFDSNRFNGKIVFNYFDKRKFRKTGINYNNALYYFLKTIYK